VLGSSSLRVQWLDNGVKLSAFYAVAECELRPRVAVLKMYRKFSNRNVNKCFCLFFKFSIFAKTLNPANLTYEPVIFMAGNYLRIGIHRIGTIS